MPSPAAALDHKKWRLDEESLAEALPATLRRARGAYFTPADVVERLLELAAPAVAEFGRKPLHIIDPACGAGAFLSAAHARWPQATICGVDLNARSLATCATRVPEAVLHQANALSDTAVDEWAASSRRGVQVWVGNPPYNGTSPLLRKASALARARAWLPTDLQLPRGTSLRDDFIFFLLKASVLLAGRDGVLAFVTSATLLDAFQHAPIRAALLSRLSLRHVVDLGPGIFRGTRVRTCLTVWSTRRGAKPHFEGHGPFTPEGPEFCLRPPSTAAESLDAAWRARGELLTTLVPVTLPGLKTRFDELLTDKDPTRLLARLRDFADTRDVEKFARSHGLPVRVLPKLRALHNQAGAIDPRKVRPLHRYRGPLPMGPPGWCYVDRALIPRGDHRLRGAYDPHADPVKLVFNVHELPLAAKVIDQPGCVTAYRHSRFAPLFVPQRVGDEGLSVAQRGDDLGPLVPNLSRAGLRWAERVGSPRAVFEAIAAFVSSDEVQNVWAPAFGTRRVLPVPLT